MIGTVTFASCYVYSPAGVGSASERSRVMRALLKASDARFIVKYAVRVRQQVADASPLAGYFDSTSVLVPIPGSGPAVGCGATTVAQHLAAALLHEGLGESIWPGLRRACAVRKSATAAPGSRPTVANHYDSFAVATAARLPAQFLLIDDVVTKGRTLLAAAARLREAFPDVPIRAFALIRTLGLVGGVDRLLDPCVGEIRWRAGDAHRNP